MYYLVHKGFDSRSVSKFTELFFYKDKESLWEQVWDRIRKVLVFDGHVKKSKVKYLEEVYRKIFFRGKGICIRAEDDEESGGDPVDLSSYLYGKVNPKEGGEISNFVGPSVRVIFENSIHNYKNKDDQRKFFNNSDLKESDILLTKKQYKAVSGE